MSKKLWSEKLIENEATSNVILSRREWESLIAGIQSLEAELESARNSRSDGVDKAVRAIETVGNLKRLQAENAELREKLAEINKNNNAGEESRSPINDGRRVGDTAWSESSATAGICLG